MSKKYKYHCGECENCCPFTEEDGSGNCFIDLRNINIYTDRCNDFKLDKSVIERNDKGCETTF